MINLLEEEISKRSQELQEKDRDLQGARALFSNDLKAIEVLFKKHSVPVLESVEEEE